ncbi:hypothetical protein OTK49_02205 [Vibrio coralliirubri]|uniref:hypothetical protein n=1 Tax=Vibrio coralliirubri TaxID=1516159 RepID=UPI0022847D4F|nr:hypothetical protein [Vibrio coralliirubri]MCY9861328.1 hypothetical protein [Vibrio coralliirubri]
MQNENIEQSVRTMVAANTSGDVTISWTVDQDKEMTEFINNKLMQGFAFFEVERTSHFLGLITRSRKKYINGLGDLSGRKVTFEGVHDDDVSKILNLNRGVAVTKTPEQNQTMTLVKGMSDPKEIASKNSVMMRPIVGG